jgi:hypothetical protein
MAEEQAEKNNTSTANALKAILKCEQESGMYPLLCHWIRGPQTGSIDKLWTLNVPLDIENTSWTAVVERQAIFEALIKNREEHFSEAMNTPSATGPVRTSLVPSNSTNILNRSYVANLTLTPYPTTFNYDPSSRPWPTRTQRTRLKLIVS